MPFGKINDFNLTEIFGRDRPRAGRWKQPGTEEWEGA
jgi:hypothetical protein